jgi:ElaB/YqjD/DUF883 family membrane-anchored ribosome-binding protein
MIFTRKNDIDAITEGMRQRASSLGEKTHDAVSYARQKAREGASSVGQKAEHYAAEVAELRHNPTALSAVGVGLALGLALGLLLGNTTSARR